MKAALEPRILILCPLAEEWSLLVNTFAVSHQVEHVHNLKIEAAYAADWRALGHRAVTARRNSLFRLNI